MFVTNWISTTKIQKISEITNFFRHYFLSRTEVIILKRSGNLTVRTALLDGLQGLATAIGMGSLNIMECIGHGSGADSAKGNKSKIQRKKSSDIPC